MKSKNEKILMEALKEAIEDYKFLRVMIIDDLIHQYLDSCINLAEQYIKDAS